MNNKWVWVAYGMVWFAVAIAVSIGIYFTKSAWCLWAFIFPMSISITTKKDDDTESMNDDSEDES